MSRLELGWSQERLAFASGVCVRTISAIECGTANPTSDVIESLAWALGSPCPDLSDRDSHGVNLDGGPPSYRRINFILLTTY